jgi:hypothetical protein
MWEKVVLNSLTRTKEENLIVSNDFIDIIPKMKVGERIRDM